MKELDYYSIGTRIRKYRKAQGITQEQLAEMVGISIPHMSHIETGNTKLSLSVLVQIAEALSVQTDALIYDQPIVNNSVIKQEISELIDKCNNQQSKIIVETVKNMKITLDKYY
ncbi:MAG: helix-turn-helix transcriptional regulator [Eubacterium sp.]|nr:helix-turn-helix transcriptional regulator [Eubacterium sp.]